ncbi:MAG TPA: hypothetical protein VF621_17560, partial [Pyrinomonadaceae bacterium]
MRSSFNRVLTAALLAGSLVSPTLILKAQDGQPATRPRRATAPAWPAAPAAEPIALPEIEPEVVRLSKEPFIRIGLATGARSVTVSTTGRVLNATDAAQQPLPLELARVRIEPRAYPSLPKPAPVETEGGAQTATSSTNRPAPSAASAKSGEPASAARSRSEREPGGVRLTARAGEAQRGE